MMLIFNIRVLIFLETKTFAAVKISIQDLRIFFQPDLLDATLLITNKSILFDSRKILGTILDINMAGFKTTSWISLFYIS